MELQDALPTGPTGSRTPAPYAPGPAKKIDLSKLNPRQREAVLHGEGPLLVLAGAGSGKTSTMAYRIAHLVGERRIPPGNILGLSFTNKAAHELKERVEKMLGGKPPRARRGEKAEPRLLISTFHSLCVRLLRTHARELGFQTNFTIVDQSDQKDILKEIFRNVRIDDRKFDLDTILFEIGQAKNRFLVGEQAEAFFLEGKRLAPDYAMAAATAYSKYQEQLRLLNSMDFDDLLFYGVKLLKDHPEVRDLYNHRFRHILVDEYQDTNPTQFKLLSLLTQHSQNITVVGDDDQSIYSWRGADPFHILQFGKHFPAARTVTLDQNYRSTNTILTAANGVIANNRHRHPKSLWSERGSGQPITEVILEEDRAEGEFVAKEIFTRGNDPGQPRPWKDFAILYRSNAQSRIFEEALRRYAIPYKIVGGMSFLDRKEVKDVLSYWRLVVNPKDDASLRRVINWPARGIGKTTIETLGASAFARNVAFYETLPEASRLAPNSKGAAACAQFYQLIEGMRQELASLPPEPAILADWARRSLDKIGAKRAIEAENVDDPAGAVRKWENVDELCHSIGQAALDVEDDIAPQLTAETDPAHSPGVTALREFLNRMTLNAKEEEEDRQRDKNKETGANEVTLLTLHGSKGLEYPVVFLVGLEEGSLPHKRTIEPSGPGFAGGPDDLGEERRLCYVGITRARDLLFITRTRTRIRYGKPVPRLPSRFLKEIPPETVITQDQSHGPDASDSDEAHRAHEAKLRDNLAGLRAMLSKNKKP